MVVGGGGRGRERDRQTDRQADRQAGRQADRQADRQAEDRKIDRVRKSLCWGVGDMFVGVKGNMGVGDRGVGDMFVGVKGNMGVGDRGVCAVDGGGGADVVFSPCGCRLRGEGRPRLAMEAPTHSSRVPGKTALPEEVGWKGTR